MITEECCMKRAGPCSGELKPILFTDGPALICASHTVLLFQALGSGAMGVAA
jgi:hypothetical protein